MTWLELLNKSREAVELSEMLGERRMDLIKKVPEFELLEMEEGTGPGSEENPFLLRIPNLIEYSRRYAKAWTFASMDSSIRKDDESFSDCMSMTLVNELIDKIKSAGYKLDSEMYYITVNYYNADRIKCMRKLSKMIDKYYKYQKYLIEIEDLLNTNMKEVFAWNEKEGED